MSSAAESMQQRANEFRQAYAKVQSEIGKVIVGHSDIVHGVLTPRLLVRVIIPAANSWRIGPLLPGRPGGGVRPDHPTPMGGSVGP